MKQIFTVGLMMTAFLGVGALAQDWYHDRDARYEGDRWRPQVFMHVRTDLEHVWAGHASDRERMRLEKTKRELTDMQAKLEHGGWDNGMLNDVIDSVRKSSHDDRLDPRDRGILADDVNRLKDFQVHHNHWNR